MPKAYPREFREDVVIRVARRRCGVAAGHWHGVGNRCRVQR
jgi:hypothetical protein